MKSNYAWKVVSAKRVREQGRKVTKYSSVVVSRGPFSTKYELGKRSRTHKRAAEKGYYLLVFRDLFSARDFANRREGLVRILKVRIGDFMKLPTAMLDTWDLKEGRFVTNTFNAWPSGTRMVNTLVPVKVEKRY